jgi:hypothetical protein
LPQPAPLRGCSRLHTRRRYAYGCLMMPDFRAHSASNRLDLPG